MKSSSSELVSGLPREVPATAGWHAALQREARQLVGIDVRALAAFRIGLGLLLIVDLLGRSLDLVAHYTDDGVLPRAAAIGLYNNNAHFSLHLMSGAWQFQVALFALAGVFAALLLVGYRTRLVTVVCWVLLVSLHSRNTLILNGGDSLLRMLMFWAMFLPLGACCSVDAWRRFGSQAGEKLIVSVGSFALLLQICLMYWFACLLKSDPIWTQEGSAIYYALHVDQITKPCGRWLLNFPELLKTLSFATLWLEGLGPFLLWLPFIRRWSRPLMVGVFASFHIGIAACMMIGLFSWVCCVALLVFLPATFWDSLSTKLGRGRRLASGVQSLWQKMGGNLHSQPAVRSITMSATRGENLASVYRPVVGNLLALMFFCLGLLSNMRSLNKDASYPKLPEVAKQVTRLARLEQNWAMFATHPQRDDGWFVIPGELADGSEVDLFTWGGRVTDDKPAQIHASFGNARWRKYMVNLWKRKHRRARLHYGKYLMRRWNREHGDDPSRELQRFKIYYWEELTQLAGPPQLRKVLLWRHAKTPKKAAEPADETEGETEKSVTAASADPSKDAADPTSAAENVR